MLLNFVISEWVLYIHVFGFEFVCSGWGLIMAGEFIGVYFLLSVIGNF